MPVTNIDGRNVRPVLASVKVRPTLRCSTDAVGRPGISSRRLVDRTRRASSGPCASCSSSTPPGSSTSVWSGSGGSGSSDRCQPSRHCCIRNRRALSAQDGHTLDRVDPHGIGTAVTSPVARSVTVRRIGRTHTPTDSAAAMAMSVVTPSTALGSRLPGSASAVTRHRPQPADECSHVGCGVSSASAVSPSTRAREG